MGFKNLFGLSVFFGSLVKLLFFTKKTPKLHQNTQEYTPQKSDKEYVEVEVTDSEPDFAHPTSKMRHPHEDSINDDNEIRSPDGSA